MKKLLVYGASYPDIFPLIDDINADQAEWEIVGIVDDVATETGFMGYPVLGGQSILDDPAYRDCLVVNNVYSRPRLREQVAERIQASGRRIPSLIHPSVKPRHSRLGQGIIVMAGARIGALAELGDHAVVRYNAIVNHHNVLDALVFVGPGAVLCGHVRIGRRAYIGAGSVVREHVEIGADAMVGMGAVVVRNVEEGSTVLGNPARPKPP